MIGFQTRNADNAIVIDSDTTPVSVTESGLVTLRTSDTTGDWNSPLGNVGSMRTEIGLSEWPLALHKTNSLVWVKMKEGKRCWMPGGFIDVDGVFYARTTRMNQPQIASGYLDVFNASGKLVWSAVEAAKVPRITGILTVPPNFDLKNNICQIYVGYSPYVLMSGIPGSYSWVPDGPGSNIWGLLFRYQNGYLQCCYAGDGSWFGDQKKYGIKIPYGIISGAP